jgi:dienelactone hydrolase
VPGKAPVIALLDSADLPQWQTWTKDPGWQVIAVAAEPNATIDTRIQALEKAVLASIQNGAADSSRVYLAGRGEAAATVFYTISRLPDLWAAGVAIGGSPEPAIDSGRFYTANFGNMPVLWVGAGPDDRTTADRLRELGLALEFRPAESITAGSILQWLAQHTRAEYPNAIDCETNSPAFGRCYWIQMTKFDAAERNDVLASTLVRPVLSAALDLGGFGFKKDAPGPGVLVSYLPPKYSGPLKMGDRIVSLDGREIPDPTRYIDFMARITEGREAVAMVQRGKEHIRLETRIILPKPAQAATARVQAKYLPEENDIQIVSRAVTEMRVEIPAPWLPAVLNWNGVPLEKIDAAGCRLLTIEKEIEKASRCP